MTDTMEIKKAPAEKIESTVAVVEAGGVPVTDTAGKPVAAPITQASLAKPLVDKKAEFNAKLLDLMKECGYNLTDTNSVAGKLIADIEVEERKQTRSKLLIQKEEDTKKLLAVHAELVAAIAPIIEKAGIKMDIPGKQIVYHVGDAGSPCMDIAYPEPLPDATKKSTKNGGIKVRKAVIMGEVHLRIPELSQNGKVAESLSKFYSFWKGTDPKTGKPFVYTGFASATAAVQNIGDGSDGKSGQDGVFKVQNVPAIPETAGNLGSKAYNIVTLTPKGHTFFNITKGKVSQTVATPTAPVAVAPTAPTKEAPKATPTAPTATLPANWSTMSKADKKAWRANQGKAS